VSGQPLKLRPYAAADEEPAIELWLRAWQAAYPAIDFSERLPWWRARWRTELVPRARIVVAELEGALAGFATIDPENGYLDQIVVAPECWGGDAAARLLDEVKRIAPGQVELLVNADNARAIRFYQKHGFAHAGNDVNPVSGRPVYRMRWRRSTASQ
jgi:putative acetyltransferase